MDAAPPIAVTQPPKPAIEPTIGAAPSVSPGAPSPTDMRSDAAGTRVAHYAQLLDAIRLRVAELGISYDLIDEFAGLADGYFSKLMCDPPIKRMGSMTLFLVLQTLGLQVVLANDVKALARTQKRFKKRGAPHHTQGKLAGQAATHLYQDFLFLRAQKGGLARAAKVSYREASRLGRRGAKLRWAKARASAAAQAAGEAVAAHKPRKKYRRRHGSNGKHSEPASPAF